MNVFSVGDGNVYELTREKFLEITHKQYPFFQDAKKYKKPFFAICPACKNPIQIINLFGKQYEEENTRKTDMHGRHFTNNINGLPSYDKQKYDECPLHNPVAFRMVEIRKNEPVNEEIRKLVENNRKKIYFDIKEITGFLFKNDNLKDIIEGYLNAKNYCYTHTNRFNIPYSILYTTRSLDLFGQRIDSSKLSERIKDAINQNSRCFEVKDNLIKKIVSKYALLNLLVTNHCIIGSKQYMTIRIEEEYKKLNTILFEEEIEMKQYVYIH